MLALRLSGGVRPYDTTHAEGIQPILRAFVLALCSALAGLTGSGQVGGFWHALPFPWHPSPGKLGLTDVGRGGPETPNVAGFK